MEEKYWKVGWWLQWFACVLHLTACVLQHPHWGARRAKRLAAEAAAAEKQRLAAEAAAAAPAAGAAPAAAAAAGAAPPAPLATSSTAGSEPQAEGYASEATEADVDESTPRYVFRRTCLSTCSQQAPVPARPLPCYTIIAHGVTRSVALRHHEHCCIMYHVQCVPAQHMVLHTMVIMSHCHIMCHLEAAPAHNML